MKIIAYTALNYGSPYLAWAIRSVIEHVDEYHVLYDPNGSHGHSRTMPIPETEVRNHLYSIAKLSAGDKLRWHDDSWAHEGQQRDSMRGFAPDTDVILVLDYDEIWQGVPALVEQAVQSESVYHRVPMVHFWRSFRRAVLHDPAYPIRVICPKHPKAALNPCLEGQPIAHMGYAIPDYLMEYKRHIHGHKAEFRTDIDWYAERWCANTQKDCHPVGSEFWDPEHVDPLDYLPAYMKLHPYFDKDIIE